MNLQLKALTLFVVFLLVTVSFPLSFGGSPGFSQNLLNSSSFTFGNTSIGSFSDQNDPNAKSASSFICGSDGQVTDIYAYISRAYTTGPVRVAIYADDSGQPGDLIAQSNEVIVTTSFLWVDFPLQTPEVVTSGSVYWLSICSDESLNLRIVLDSGVRVHNGNAYDQGFSDPFGPEWGGPDPIGAMSIYASENLDNSELSALISPTSVNIPLGGYQQFSSTVNGGSSPYSYQWYINDTAASGGTDQNLDFTPTQAGTYKIYLIVVDSQSNQVQSNIANNIVVYNQSVTNLLSPDWSNVTQDFFDLIPGAVNPVLTAADVTDRNANFVADPFIFHEGSSWYMFFEVETDSAQEIGVATSGDGLSWTYNQIVISDSSSYLSYPYVFKWEGIYYMIPNSFPLGVTLYKATNFPYSWTLVSTLISNQNFIPADASIFRYNSEWWMFTGTDSDLRLFYSFNLANPDSWHEHPMSPLITNDSSKVRGGGRVTVFDSDKIIRFAQKGDVAYGEADRAFQVDVLNETYYAEHEIPESPLISASGTGWNSWAMHTIDPWWNGTNWIVAVDGGGDYWWSIGIYVTTRPPVAISPTHVGMNLGRFQTFSSSISIENAPYSYQWYQNDTAVLKATSQSWTFTPTSTGNYKIYLNVTDNLNNQFQSNIANVTVNPPAYNFSIMQITDTQTLNSAYLPDNPDLYSLLCNWIVNSSGMYNLQMVVHTGDIINEYWDASQWQDANTGMSILANNGVPYVWCAGNHDQTTDDGWSGDPNSGWVGEQYSAFNSLSFVNDSYWAGDCFEGKNTAAKFSVGNYNFLVIDIEAFANDSTLSWMRGLLNTYSNLSYNIIVATHVYLSSPNGDFANSIGDGTWEVKLQNLLNEYPNVFMTLNGHCGGDPAVNVHNEVNGRTQIEYDRQETDDLQGACSVRIYSFDLNSQTVAVSTYSVWDDLWITDSGDSFSFSANLTSIPTVNITPTNVRIGLGKSEIFDSSVSGGSPPYAYQWYLNEIAVSAATGANWTFTPTQSGQYSIYLNVTDSLNYQTKSNVVNDIEVYAPPSVSISPLFANITLGGYQQFNSAVTGGLAPYTYQWCYANGTAISGSTTSTLIYTANFTGSYGIYLNATDSLNCTVQSNMATINVYSQPSATINPNSVNITVGDTQQFNSTIVGGLTPYAYQWYLNDTAVTGATSSVWNFTPTVAGHYRIYLNVTDALNFKVQSNIVIDITVYPQLTVSISPTLVNMIVGTTQTFNSTVQGGAQPLTYQWFLNGTAVTGANSSTWNFTPTQTGHYNVYLNVTDSLNSQAQSNILTDILVYIQLSVSISPTSANIVFGGSQQFNSTVVGGVAPFTYQWVLNGTAVSGAADSIWNFNPSQTGNFNIYLNITDALNTKTQSNVVADIMVYPQLAVSISPTSMNTTVGTPQTFVSIVSGGDQLYTYQWYLNDNAVPDTNNSSWTFIPQSIGPYKIYVKVTDNNIFTAQSNNATVLVETPLVVSFNAIKEKMYLGESQTFNSTVSGGTAPYSYQWYQNNSAILGATSENWIFTPTSAGTYRIFLKVTDAFNIIARSDIEANITVYPLLSASISPALINTTIGTPQLFNCIVTGGSQPYTYQWYLNGDLVAGAINNSWTFIPASKGTYNIFVNVTDINSVTTQSNSATVIVETPTNVTLNPTQVKMYLGQSQTINSSVQGGTAPFTYQWYLNDTAILGATNQNFIFTPTSAGNYKIYLTATDALNILTVSDTSTDITVYSQLLVSINPMSLNMTIGTAQTFSTTVFGGAQPYVYQWYLNGSPILNASSSTWTFIPVSSGDFSVYLIVADNNTAMIQSNNATLMVESLTNVTISPVQVRMYLGQSQTFDSIVSGGTTPYSFQWYLNDTAVSGANSQNWTFTPTLEGHYKIYLNITDAFGIKTQSNIITDIIVYSQLIVSINPVSGNMTIGEPQTFNSTVSGGAQPYIYQWYLNGTQISNANESSWTFTPTSSGNSTIYLIVTDKNTGSAQSNNATITVGTLSITGFVVQSGGSCYTTPAIIITGGGGTGATATARVSNGVIIGIVLTNPGSGYTSAPTVIIRDPSPRANGASVTATL